MKSRLAFLCIFVAAGVAQSALHVTTTSLPDGYAGVAYSQALAATGGPTPYTWSVTSGQVNAGLTLNSEGTITGSPNATGSSTFTAQVKDSSGATATQSLTLTVDPAVNITTTSLPTAIVGVAYSQALAASGGTTPFQWSITTGTLPAGVTLSTAGSLSGTPGATTAGSYPFTVQVKDAKGATDTQALTLTVAAAVTVTTASLPGGGVGVAYSQTLAASGGAGTYTWTISTGTLPAGLTLTGNTIGGTPSAVGTSSFTVKAASGGSTATKNLSIAIASTLAVTTSSLPGGTVGTAYQQSLAASGGTGGYSWAVTVGSVPAGLSLNATGAITGSPTTAATSNFTVQVTDSSGVKATAPLSIVISTPPLTVTTSTLPGGVVGTGYQQSLAASGGTGGYSWAVTVGSLPAGLSLNAAGAITGSPTTAGTSNFTVQVTDSSGTKATAPLSIVIAPPALTVTTSTLLSGSVGAAYQQTLAASGGTGGYSWAVTVGSLPAGLSLSAAGVISGTASTAGTSNFTVQVTDSSGTKATAPLSIVIAPPQLKITTTSLPGGTVGVAYQQTLTATGGSGGYTWSVGTGSLPAGLTLNADGTIMGTPTTAGTSGFTAQVADSSGVKTAVNLTIVIAVPQLTVTTNSLPSGTVGVAYQQTLAASGGTGGYTWSVSGGALPANLSLSSAGAITGTPTTAATSNFTVQVTDSSGTKATAALSIVIAPPQLTVTTSSLPSGTVGVAYQQTLAASGGSGGYTWATTVGTLPAGLSLSAAGAITGTPTTAATSNFTVQVTDSSGTKATAALSIVIAPPQLTVTTSSLPSGTVGVAYQQTLAASGGSGGYTWATTVGTLPAGLSLSAAGAITGTPTTAATSNFTVQVTDSSGTKATAALSIVVASPQLTITTSSLPSGTVGTAYQQTLAASGGSGGYTWAVTVSTLPAGLSLSAAGAITGTPTTAATSNFTVQVTDSSGTKATAALSIVVALPQLTITTSSLPSGTVGTAYQQTLAASGGSGGYTWAVTVSTLPAGLSLSAAGAITGTPTTAATSNFTVQVTDSSGTKATAALSIVIAQPQLTVTTSSLPGGTVGTAYQQTLAASGGSGGYTWAVTVSTLPAGLSLSAAGAITGTPTTAATSNFTVQVTDSSGTKATAALSIVVASPQLTITTTSLPGGTVGVAYQQTLAASGGSGGYTWAVTVSTLPAGLSLSTAGAITGTPTTAATANFSVQVTDSSGAKATAALSIVIAQPQLTVTTSSLPGGTVGTAYQQTLSASGGTGGYTWAISGGTLPAGLSLSAAGAITGTPTTAGTSNFTAQVTDSSGAKAINALNIVIAPPQLTVTTSSLPGGTVGTAYQQTLAATGGSGGYTWALTVSTLPAGLSLSTAGAITGTPTTAATSNFTVQVTDSSGAKATAPLTIVIASPQLTVTTSSLPGGTVGIAYQQTLAASGGSGGYTWAVSAGTLPAGLSLSTAGAVTGTPTTAATSNFTVQVTDSSGAKATAPLTIVIAQPQLTVTTASLPNGTVGIAYQQTLAASGGAGGYTWTVSVGTLPASLSLSSAGAITGTPTTAATANFTVQVTDSSGTKATAALTIVIAQPQLTVTTSSLPGGRVGAAYQQTVTASGGTGGYSWAVSTGSLPASLSLSTAGVITGTPATAGTSIFTVQVTDSSGSKATASLSLVIAPAQLIITTSSLAGGIVGTAYQQSLSASGGTGGYTWSFGLGALPLGLSLSTGGSITGTSTTAGTATFTVEVTDSSSARTTGTFAITISPALNITTPPDLTSGSASSAFSQTFTASGGAPPYTWKVSGTLPAGLSLASQTGILSGTPTQVGTFPITVTATDSAGAQASSNYSLQVVSGLVIATAPVLPSATVGAQYSTTLQAAGGTAPYQWTVSAGALPGGLNFSGTGQITGTPTSSGTFTFTVQVTDANSNKATKQFTLTVAGAITVTSTSLPAGATQVPYAQTLTATGGTPPYSWSVTAGSLPNGLTLQAAGGTLVGTPTATGDFTFTVTVTDANSVTAQRQFTLIIAAGLTITNASSLPNGTTGTTYSFTLQASGGQSPYAWSISQGTLPSGLSLNAASGLISGTPTASGTFNFTAQVSDADDASATHVETIVIGLPALPAISINGFSGTVQPLQQPLIDIALANPFPVALTGTVTLSFTPGGANPVDDPSIQFSTGGRSATFTIPANATHATFGASQFAVQTGSVQGTITLSIVALQAGGASLTIPSGLTQTVTVSAAAPVIETLAVVPSSGGFQVQIVGIADTRELTQVVVTFQPASGTTVQTSQLTVPLAAAATAWFQSSGAATYGGQFTLTLPFSFSGTVSLSSVSAVLSSSAGNSASASANY